MSTVQQVWMGYGHDGGRAVLDLGGPGSKALLLGSRSRELAALAAVGAKEAGAKPIVIDLDGSVANNLSGHFDTYDYRSFLYDAFRLEEPEAWHSQLAAAAYTVALDLSSEEEAIINSAMQVVASDGTLLSPVSLHDVMGKVEGFRGFYVDKLNGRIGALRLFDATDDRTFETLLAGDLVLDFHSAPYSQAGELAAALFIAKILAKAHSKGLDRAFLMITEAHRVFKASPRPQHSNRLLAHLFGWPGTVVMAAEHQAYLNPLLIQSCPVKIYSSDAWHSQPSQVQSVLSGSFVLHDRRSERRLYFVPRRIPIRTGEYAAARGSKLVNPDLARMILEEVEKFPLSTPESVAQYIAPEFLPGDVSAALAALQKQGNLVLEPKDSDSGPKVFAFTITERGRNLLKELRS
jgi:hypothetical protein